MPSSWRGSRSPTRMRWVIYWAMCPLSCWSLLYFGCCCHPNKLVSSQHKTLKSSSLLALTAHGGQLHCDAESTCRIEVTISIASEITRLSL